MVRVVETHLVIQLLCAQMLGTRRAGRPPEYLTPSRYELDLLAAQAGLPSDMKCHQVALDRTVA